MPHIHTGLGHHDLTVSAFIVRMDLGEPKLMLHWHKKLEAYLQFGGHVELNENPWQALTHELLEETGYSMSQLELLQPSSRLLNTMPGSVLHPQPVCINTHPIGSDHFHIDMDYAFVTGEPPAHEVGEGESTKFTYATKPELEEDDGMFRSVREIGLFIFEECLPDWERTRPPLE